MAAILNAVSVPPFIHRLFGRAKPFGQNRRSLIAGLDRGSNFRRRRCLLVKLDQHGRPPFRLAGKQSPGLFSDPLHSLKTDLAIKKADRRGSM
jgi:hypothetical protein